MYPIIKSNIFKVKPEKQKPFEKLMSEFKVSFKKNDRIYQILEVGDLRPHPPEGPNAELIAKIIKEKPFNNDLELYEAVAYCLEDNENAIITEVHDEGQSGLYTITCVVDNNYETYDVTSRDIFDKPLFNNVYKFRLTCSKCGGLTIIYDNDFNSFFGDITIKGHQGKAKFDCKCGNEAFGLNRR